MVGSILGNREMKCLIKFPYINFRRVGKIQYESALGNCVRKKTENSIYLFPQYILKNSVVRQMYKWEKSDYDLLYVIASKRYSIVLNTKPFVAGLVSKNPIGLAIIFSDDDVQFY